jgi:hypothetical protein
MPNRRVEDLVIKIISMGVTRVNAESIVSGLSEAQVANALSSSKALKAIIDIPSRTR